MDQSEKIRPRSKASDCGIHTATAEDVSARSATLVKFQYGSERPGGERGQNSVTKGHS